MLKAVYPPVKFPPIRRQKSKNLKRAQSVLACDSMAHKESTEIGRLGNKRIPLPACAYDCIRAKFSLEIETMTAFEDE